MKGVISVMMGIILFLVALVIAVLIILFFNENITQILDCMGKIASGGQC